MRLLRPEVSFGGSSPAAYAAGVAETDIHCLWGEPLAQAAPYAGSSGLLAVAAQEERFDRALWTPTATATSGAGNSTALVGTPETVAQALLDYYGLGVTILSAHGYKLLDDTSDFGRQVIPIVREEAAKRDAAELAVPD